VLWTELGKGWSPYDGSVRSLVLHGRGAPVQCAKICFGSSVLRLLIEGSLHVVGRGLTPRCSVFETVLLRRPIHAGRAAILLHCNGFFLRKFVPAPSGHDSNGHFQNGRKKTLNAVNWNVNEIKNHTNGTNNHDDRVLSNRLLVLELDNMRMLGDMILTKFAYEQFLHNCSYFLLILFERVVVAKTFKIFCWYCFWTAAVDAMLSRTSLFCRRCTYCVAFTSGNKVTFSPRLVCLCNGRRIN